MFRIDAGSHGPYCDRHSRRSFLELGMAGMASLALPDILRAKESSHAAGRSAKDTAVILIWLDGGPSHLDTYDMKPKAPADYRGFWRPISTNVPGIEISELLPRQAKVADKFSVIRSLHHGTGNHWTAAHFMLTGRGGPTGLDTPARYPSVGAVASKVCGPRRPGIPAYASIPHAMTVGLHPGYFGGHYLGVQHNPFECGLYNFPDRPNFKVGALNLLDGISIERLENRRNLSVHLDHLRREADKTGAVESMDRFQRQALDLITSPTARNAFDIAAEPAAVRDRYGRNGFGQSVLLARRLVEAGSTFVTVQSDQWDHHWDLKPLIEKFLPPFDMGVSALFEDLAQRGLLERTLVIACGEFGRTPKLNDGGNGGPPLTMGSPGRDHWGGAMSCLIGGGGVKGGRIVGSTDARGEFPASAAYEPCDLHTTIYHVLGIDPATVFHDRLNRPIPAVDHGRLIAELF